MAIYLDKDGNRIAAERWVELCRDDSYRIIREFDNGEMLARLVWVGALTQQQFKGFKDCWPVFQMIVKNYREDGSLVDDPCFNKVTFPDLDAAVKGYEKMLIEITDAIRKEDGTLNEIGNTLIPPPPPDPNVPTSEIEGLTDDIGAW